MKTDKKVKMTFVIAAVACAVGILTNFPFEMPPIKLGLDLQGGVRMVLQAKETEKLKVTNDAVLGALSVIRNRIDGSGINEPIIQRKGMDQIIVELAGFRDPERARKLIGDTAQLSFVEAEWAPDNIENLSQDKINRLSPPDSRLEYLVVKDKDGVVQQKTPLFLKKEPSLTGADLKTAAPGTDQYGKPTVQIEFTKEGSKKFSDTTARSIGKPLAILLDSTIISAPKVNERISGGKAVISGSFTISEMKDLVVKLKAGALPIPLEIISEKFVGPTLGQDSIQKSKTAGLIGFAFICLFMLLFYRLAGFVAGLALVLYVVISFSVLKFFNATLTLPGIAGFILTMGMAVDANVIIFERIKEEIKNGQSLFNSIVLGFNRAFKTILDANITTLIAAIVLFWLGTGSIRGFAVTLSIGILVSMFTAIFITRVFVDGFANIKALGQGFLFKNTEKGNS